MIFEIVNYLSIFSVNYDNLRVFLDYIYSGIATRIKSYFNCLKPTDTIPAYIRIKEGGKGDIIFIGENVPKSTRRRTDNFIGRNVPKSTRRRTDNFIGQNVPKSARRNK